MTLGATARSLRAMVFADNGEPGSAHMPASTPIETGICVLRLLADLGMLHFKGRRMLGVSRAGLEVLGQGEAIDTSLGPSSSSGPANIDHILSSPDTWLAARLRTLTGKQLENRYGA